MKIPPKVTNNIKILKVHPSSPAIDPGSNVRIRLAQNASKKESESESCGEILNKTAINEATIIMENDAMPKNNIIELIPLENKQSIL
jgi:hypothetical protein